MTKRMRILFSVLPVKLIALLVLLIIGASAVSYGYSPVLADGWAMGDVVVARSFESLQTYYEGTHSIFDNNGNYREGVQGPGTTGADCAFAASGDLYAAQYFDPAIAVFSSSPPHNIIQTIDTRVNAQNNTPGSIVFAANGDFLVALYQADGFRGIARYNPEGVRQDLYDFGAIGIAGIAGMDLAADQRTLFYTAYDSGQILRYDLVTRQQLDPFAQVGDTLGEIKLLPPGDGSNGLVVSHRVSQPASDDVKRLNGSGNIEQTYDVAGEEEWDGVDLDPNGTSVWANSTTSAYRFNIATAALERGPFGPTTSYPISKLCVRSEAIIQPTSTPTPTPTALPTNTPTATPTPPACEQYQFATSTGIIVPAVTDIGSHCDDCTVAITLPFPYALYGTSFTSANISSNGNIQFQSINASNANVCLPTTTLNYAILPYWDDLSTVGPGPTSGVYTSVSGTAPNRIFNIEWRAILVAGGTSINFEARLYEGQTRFDVIFGAGTNVGNSATVGVQRDTGSRSTQYACNSAGPAPGVMLTFTLPACPTATSTSTPTTTPEPQPPLFTNSYYIQENKPDQLKSLGCAARLRGETGVAILHFGSPRILPDGAYGTKVLDSETYLNIDQIKTLTTNFALGYAQPTTQCGSLPPGTPRDLTIVAGVSNSARIPVGSDNYQDNEYLTRQHGEAWADMINELYEDVFVKENLLPDMRIASGYDSEFYGHPSVDCRNAEGRRGPCPTGNPPFNEDADEWTVWHVQNATDVGTRDWAEGYDAAQGKTNNLTLFNYGSCESCPRDRNPSQWNANEVEVLTRVSQMTWVMDSVVPFPQIYRIPIPYEWYNVRWFAQVQGNRDLTVRGALTGCQRASQCTPIPNPTRIVPRYDEACRSNREPACDQYPWTDYNCGTCPFLPPSVGWQALSDMLSSPNSPEGIPNPDVTPQPSLPNGVSDIIDQP